MSDAPDDVEGALVALHRATGRRYRLERRLAGGETGAHLIRGPDGTRTVMKWARTGRARDLRTAGVGYSERLRTDAGWPVPREWTVDTGDLLVVLQEFLPGGPAAVVDDRLVDRVLELHDRRIGLAQATDTSTWPAPLFSTLTVGGDGYCRHDSLRHHDPWTADLLTRIIRFGASLQAGDFPGTDVIHWDLHPGNLLADGSDRLIGIVDTDFAMVGDAAFDLVMFALTSTVLPTTPSAGARLRDAAFGDLGGVRTQAYLAHLFLRLLDWPIRRGAPDEVAVWLDHSERLLRI